MKKDYYYKQEFGLKRKPKREIKTNHISLVNKENIPKSTISLMKSYS